MSIYKSCWVIAVLLLGVAFGQEPTTPSAEPVGPPAINSCSVPDTDAYRAFQTVYTWIQVVGMIISIVGSFLTILTFTIFSGIRTYPIKLICWLCVTVFCGQVLFLTVNQWAPGTGFCGYGGALSSYYLLCILLLSFVVLALGSNRLVSNTAFGFLFLYFCILLILTLGNLSSLFLPL
jgi:hypothetical protein